MNLRRYSFWLLLLSSWLASGCRKHETAGQSGTLPTLVLRDETPDVLLTWLDVKGEFHTTQHIAEVPLENAENVRVVLTNREDETRSGLIYVADLRRPMADGTYAIRVLPRSVWEGLADARRRPVGAPTPSGTSEPPSAPGAPAGRTTIIVYGASWCRPCHDVADYLRSRGVPVVSKDIEADSAAAEEMQRKLNQAGLRGGSIPVLDVGGKILVGYDRRSLDAALEAIPRGTTAL